MEALLAKYLAKPTVENAKRVVAYNNKHMMVEFMLNLLERAVLAECKMAAAANRAALKAA